MTGEFIIAAAVFLLLLAVLAVLGRMLALLGRLEASVRRLAEQWLLWIVVDAVTIVLWAVHFAQGQEHISMLLMWSVYLLNAIVMYLRWNREAKRHAV